jgi:hypothetical protein
MALSTRSLAVAISPIVSFAGPHRFHTHSVPVGLVPAGHLLRSRPRYGIHVAILRERIAIAKARVGHEIGGSRKPDSAAWPGGLVPATIIVLVIGDTGEAELPLHAV